MRKVFPIKSARLILVVGSPLILLVALLVVLNVNLPTAYADPGIIYVDGVNGTDTSGCGAAPGGLACATIGYTLTNAVPGDVVYVAPAVYTETFSMQPGVVISGSGAATTIIDGGGTGPVVSAGSGITESAILRGIAVRGGSATDGGGLSITDGASPIVEDCVVRDNHATNRGGGIFIDSATPIIRSTIVYDNDQVSISSYTYGGGGIYVRSCSPTISDTQVVSNTASRYGGGIYIINTGADPVLHDVDVFSNTAQRGGGVCIYNSASPTINGGEVSRNRATGTGSSGSGGGIYVHNSSPSISSTQILSNAAAYHGGGMYLSDSADLNLDGTQVISNTAERGGGLYLNNSPATLIANIINYNQAQDDVSGGGGLYLYQSDATLRRNTILSNTSASYGGGLYTESGDVTLSDNLIASNTADWSSGGLHIYSGDSVLTGNTIISNSAGAYAGGMTLEQAWALLDENTIRANTAGQEGGGVWVFGSIVTLTNNSVVENQAGDEGGGMYVGFSDVLMINNTVVDNQCAESEAGGGLHVDGGASIRLLHNTVARNSDSGVYVLPWDTYTNTVDMVNTILVGHTVGISVTGGNAVTLEGTLWGSDAWANETDWSSDSAIFTGTINIWGAPAFVDADGGDYHIGVGSAAIDAGMDSGVTADIDGDSRPRNSGYDIGVDEYVGTCFARLNDGMVYDSVQAAVDASTQSTDVVKVAGYCTGVEAWSAPVGYSGSSVVTQVVYVSKTVTVQGGYTTTSWTTPDPDANPTTLDAQGQGRVLFIAGDISPKVEGLRITGGSAAGLGGHIGGENGGGGLYVFTATATISNVWVFGNDSPAAGPGSEGEGGGMFVISATATIRNSRVFSNTATYGGGVALQHDTTFFVGNVVVSNSTPSSGQSVGGGLNLNRSHATLVDNTIAANYSGSGGGLFLKYGSVTLASNVIADNQVWYRGGGLYLEWSDATLTNNVIANNQSPAYGGGLYIYRSSPHLLHTTIAQNSGGDGVHMEGLSYMPVFTNTIIAGHTVGIRCEDPPGARLNSTLWYSNTTDWQNTSVRTSDYFGDPAFVDPDGGDYHIRTESAALDAGVFAGVTTDLDGDARPTNPARPDAPDLGADENVVLTVRRPVTDTMTFGAACARVVFTETPSLTEITATVVYTYPTSQSSDRPLPRYYVITPTGTGPYTASLALCYTQQEFTQSDVADEGSLRLYRLAGGWEAYSSTVDIDNDVVTATQVTGFSKWALGGPGGEPGPTAITLVSFTAEWDGDAVLVAWETALEIDTVGFSLWRSEAPGSGYVRVNGALIPAESLGGVEGGFYEYADSDVTPGGAYYYKLEEVEVGGVRNWYGPVTPGDSSPAAVTISILAAQNLASVWWLVVWAMSIGAAVKLLNRRREGRCK